MVHVADVIRPGKLDLPQMDEAISREVPKLLLRYAALTFAAATAIATDQWMSRHGQKLRSDEVSMSEHDNGFDTSIYVTPGTRMDGGIVDKLLHPHLSAVGNEGYISLAQRGFDPDAVTDTLLRQRSVRLEENPDAKASLLQFSMGGIVLAHALSDDTSRREFGPIKSIVLDSSPHAYQSVRRPARAALNTARLGQNSVIMQKAGDTFMDFRGKRLLVRDNLHDDDFMKEYTRSSARFPMDLSSAQGRYIRESSISHLNPLHDVAESVTYVQSPFDDVVDTEMAIEEYARLFPGLQVVTDHNRPHGSHAGGVSKPDKIVELLRAA